MIIWKSGVYRTLLCLYAWFVIFVFIWDKHVKKHYTHMSFISLHTCRGWFMVYFQGGSINDFCSIAFSYGSAFKTYNIWFTWHPPPLVLVKPISWLFTDTFCNNLLANFLQKIYPSYPMDELVKWLSIPPVFLLSCVPWHLYSLASFIILLLIKGYVWFYVAYIIYSVCTLFI